MITATGVNTRQRPSIERTALIVGCAAALQMLESFVPFPVPGVKPGLANIFTLVALLESGIGAAVEVALLRTLVASLLLGTFLSPSFFLSLSGALASSLAMGLVCSLSRRGTTLFSAVGISVLGAVTSNMAQLGIVYAVYIRQTGILYLLPWLGVSAVVTGWVTGLVALRVRAALRDGGEKAAAPAFVPGTAEGRQGMAGYVDLSTPVHVLPAWVKIAAVLAVAGIAVAVHSFRVYSLLFILLLAVAGMARLRLAQLLAPARRALPFILLSFLTPLLFIDEGKVLASLGPVTITGQGLADGGIFAFRILLMLLCASLLTRTTTAVDLSEGLSLLLVPLRRCGIPTRRATAVLALSLAQAPLLLQGFIDHVRSFAKERSCRRPTAALEEFIASIYRHTEDKRTAA